MPIPTLILPPRYSADANAIGHAAEQAGWHVERFTSWRVPAGLQERPEIVLYGEPLFAEIIAASLSLALLEAPYDWLVQLPQRHTGRAIQFTTLGNARHLLQPTFVKPVDGKCFAATVYASGRDLPPVDLLPDAVPVLTAEPIMWEVEFRCFVLERRLAAFSPYLLDGALAQDESGTWDALPGDVEDAHTYITDLLADTAVSLPPAVVIDVGRIRDRGWAVVEANAAWGAGICGCNPSDILPVLRRACLKREQITPIDVPWIIEKEIEL